MGLTSRVIAVVSTSEYGPKSEHAPGLWLNGAVLLRGQPFWNETQSQEYTVPVGKDYREYAKDIAKAMRATMPSHPPGAGGSVGRHFVTIVDPDRAVWLNGELLISLGQDNVLLLDDVDNLTVAPRVHSKLLVGPDLGSRVSEFAQNVASNDPALIKRWLAQSASEHSVLIKQRLIEHPTIRSFLE
jgi:hypothetical protein